MADLVTEKVKKENVIVKVCSSLRHAIHKRLDAKKEFIHLSICTNLRPDEF